MEIPTERRYRISISIWAVGVVATAAVGVCQFLLPKNEEATYELLIISIGIVLTLVCELRLMLQGIEKESLSIAPFIKETRAKLSDIQHATLNVELEKVHKIFENSDTDAFFAKDSKN